MIYRVGETLGLETDDGLCFDMEFEVEVDWSGNPELRDDAEGGVVKETCTSMVMYWTTSGEDHDVTLHGDMAEKWWQLLSASWLRAKQRLEDMRGNAIDTAFTDYLRDWQRDIVQWEDCL